MPGPNDSDLWSDRAKTTEGQNPPKPSQEKPVLRKDFSKIAWTTAYSSKKERDLFDLLNYLPSTIKEKREEGKPKLNKSSKEEATNEWTKTFKDKGANKKTKRVI